MIIKHSFVIFLLLQLIAVLAKPREKHDRAYDRDLSSVEHETDDHTHHAEYDHEAFLGKDEAKRYDQLSPEESRASLSKLVDNYIDTDKDGKVTEEELRAWIALTSRKYVEDNRDNQWKEMKLSDDAKLDWDTYKNLTYGDISETGDDSEYANNMPKKDERRWKKADADQDGKLSKEEFLSFLHPEEVKSMHDFVVEETMEDIDTNKDGRIDLEEFINDLWRPDHEGEKEPDWVATERQQFGVYRDKNKDGYLDREEVRQWILPQDYDHVEAETKHLMKNVDTNNDKVLSKEEILENYDVFVGSQATDFGETLSKHLEL